MVLVKHLCGATVNFHDYFYIIAMRHHERFRLAESGLYSAFSGFGRHSSRDIAKAIPDQQHTQSGLIECAVDLGLPWLYLGYYVAQSQKMRYKARFQPAEIFRDGAWQLYKNNHEN